MKIYQRVVILFLIFILSIDVGTGVRNENNIIIYESNYFGNPINAIVSPNSILSVTIMITNRNYSNIGGLYSESFTLSYNPNIVIVQNVTEGDILGIYVDINNTKGVTDIGVHFRNNSINNSNRTIIFAKMTLKAVGSVNDISPLDVSGELLYDSCYPRSSVNNTSCFLGDEPSFLQRGNFTIVQPGIIKYDTNTNGKIERDEAVQSIMDYFSGLITKEDAITVLTTYFRG